MGLPWVRLDDKFWRNQKMRRLSHAARGVHVDAMSYCADTKEPTGFLTFQEAADRASGSGRRRLMAELVEVGAWEPVNGGFLIHDFDHYLDRGSRDRCRTWREKKRTESVAVTSPPRHLNVTETSPRATGLETISTPGWHPEPEPEPEPVSKARTGDVVTQADAVKDDPGLQLAVLMEPILGHVLSPIDQQNCEVALQQFEYMTGIQHFAKRAEEHNTVCEVKHWPKPRTIEGYFDSWRRENEYMADNGALKPRARGGADSGLTRINVGDLVRQVK